MATRNRKQKKQTTRLAKQNEGARRPGARRRRRVRGRKR